MRTDAAVVPGFTVWDPTLRKYRLRFDQAVTAAKQHRVPRHIGEMGNRIDRIGCFRIGRERLERVDVKFGEGAHEFYPFGMIAGSLT